MTIDSASYKCTPAHSCFFSPRNTMTHYQNFSSPTQSTNMYTSSLQSLGSVAVQPANVSRRSQAMLMLKNIDKVQVSEAVKVDGHRYYFVDIYLKQVQSRIPTNNANEGDAIPHRRPDLQVKHRYSDFMDLRYAMHKHARGSHEDHTKCSYCTRIVNYAVVGRAQPGLFTALTQVGSAKIALVDAFINDMMQLALNAEAQYPGRCRAQHTVPALLSAFLQPEPQDEY